MALVTLHLYSGAEVSLNPEHVQGVSSHEALDHDAPLPDDFYLINGDGLPEIRQDKVEEANALRTSTRTLVLMANGVSYEVQGSVAEVKKALK